MTSSRQSILAGPGWAVPIRLTACCQEMPRTMPECLPASFLRFVHRALASILNSSRVTDFFFQTPLPPCSSRNKWPARLLASPRCQANKAIDKHAVLRTTSIAIYLLILQYPCRLKLTLLAHFAHPAKHALVEGLHKRCCERNQILQPMCTRLSSLIFGGTHCNCAV